MEHLITIEKALELSNPLFVDLRSPVEYEEAHIPGALNVPLFEDEERALIGTVYKKESPEDAIDKGFQIAAPKLPEIYNKLKPYCSAREIVLYCWRGGMRSRAISQILDVLNMPHFRLIGGYKSFRRCVNSFFEDPFKQEIIVLHGLTGVGKTHILEKLREEGYPAVDLEGLANNRGSVFGHIGLEKAPSQKQFEGLLYWECRRYQQAKRIAVECESRRIGSVLLPASFFNAMQSGRKVLIYDSPENRIKRLVATYTRSKRGQNDEQLISAVNRLRKRLGNAKTDELIGLLSVPDYGEVVRRLLADYYDPLYHYPDKPSPDYEFNLDARSMDDAIAVLKEILIK